MTALIQTSYFVVAVLFILGLKAMASPVTAKRGIVWAGIGMVLATAITFATPGMQNFVLMIVAIVLGGGVAWYLGRVVKMTDMPQMVAIYNGMGGGAAAAIAALEFARGHVHGVVVTTLAVLGALIGSVAFSGSCIAFAKLQGIMKKAWRLPAQNAANLVLALVVLGLAIKLVMAGAASETGATGVVLDTTSLLAFFLISLLLGVVLTAPIGGADMPVVISLLNAFTGLAVGLEGYVLGNPALIIAGIVVGASGTLLTQLMSKSMNRPITNIIFAPITGEAQAGETITGTMKEASAMDAAAMMRFAQKVIIVPGYGMAVAGAQHKVWEMAKQLQEAGVEVKFAIHPVAGRMPGHMNVLLAEAGVPYDMIFDLEEINEEFSQTDVALVIGANDVVNPSARTDKSSPIYGMPILNVDHAQNVIVNKRGKGTGYSGIENALFYGENTRLLYGSAQQAIAEIIANIKTMQT
ncbi:NAD(P) transhydrogenase subunit beta [Rugosibacter aromaticivorans]|uniref:NAD(P) transhydrogenase subunit beta n=1 Tax=Rugosibacter aromaticivorans TaxID=1565605 RepID=A0A0C5J100_9PROT|nr:NAD(P)(+) transhydrogenase (Re/Si-specific) subunit beta [Rugosibacter aromaticivorans]AJP48772.1 NAD(P) transhydrogenase subunit beta [Rugosibacter aromaticivorans]TBR14394.1 MAG: NAD(P)(+) transhydrogenase (Re/Si-specific) subunit beta [Rugosibacter sp.]